MEQDLNELYMNGQIVKLKNPGTDGLADFLKLARAMSKIPKDNKDANFMDYFDDAAINASVRLINLTLDKTFPSLPKEEKETWGMENAMLILPKVIEMCSPKGLTNDQDRAEKLKERLNPS
jgi:hypothetical protein